MSEGVMSGSEAGEDGRRHALEPLHAAGDGSRCHAAAPARPRRHQRSPAPPAPLTGPPEPSSSESDDSATSPAHWSKHHLPHAYKGEAVGAGGREWRRCWGYRRPAPRGPERLVPVYSHPSRTAFPPEALSGHPLSCLCSYSYELEPWSHRAQWPLCGAVDKDTKWDLLSQDIWDKFVVSQQTEETFKKKMNLWRFLYLSIKSLFPRYGLYLVGSTMSGFGLDSSDMDLCLYVRPIEAMDPRSHALVHLGFILNFMKSYDSVLSNADLIQAKVPILKFRDARHGIDVDLNCNNVVGIRNTNLLHAYSQLDWRVRPIVLVVKLWAQANNINDARHCTLSSYSLTLMVIHYLQCGTSPAVLPCLRVTNGCGASAWEAPPHPHGPRNTQSLAELLLGFLKYYAHFQYDKMAVSIRAGRCVPVAECKAARSLKNDPHQWKLMCVEEPYDLTNTARSVYDPETFDKILTVFRRSAETLSRGLRLRDITPLALTPHLPPHI